jgi:protocatechuate 3,4-dioxygenase beta subunit
MLHALLVLAATNVLALAPPHEPGVRLRLIGVVRDASGHPVPNVSLHVYQTDASGRYTPGKPMDEPHARLSGHVVTDDQGAFEVLTIRPGGYPRSMNLGGVQRHIPAHIHIDATADGHRERRVQVVFSDDPSLADPYWQHWVASLGQPVVTPEREGQTLVAHVAIVVE